MDRISHYRIVRRIGAGGMGEVWRAVDERLGRDVAIKVLARGKASHERAQRMLREAQAASGLNHPGIVTVHDIGEVDGQPYVVMELVEGRRFSDLGRVAPAEAVRLCALAADALGAAHERGILHRDVKSDNLMKLPDGRVKVLDFGLAKVMGTASTASGLRRAESPVSEVAATLAGDSGASDRDALAEQLVGDTLPVGDASPTPGSADLTRVGDLVGTPAYMAPEQARGEAVDARSEIFSLGIVLYELMCGRRPFLADEVEAMLELIRKANVTPPSRATEDPALARYDAAVLHALARVPAERPSDMQAFAAELRAIAGDDAARAKRRKRNLGLAGAVCTAGTAVVFTAFLSKHDAPPPLIELPPAPKATGPTWNEQKYTALTRDGGCSEFPAIMPDGSYVIFASVRGADEVLARVDKAMHPETLTHGPGWDLAPAISPDGKTVAYLGKHGGPYTAMLSDLDFKSPPRTLAPGAMRPAWSPDGKYVWAGSGRKPQRWNVASGQAERTLNVPKGLVLLIPLELADGSVAGVMLKPEEQAIPIGLALFPVEGEMKWLYEGELDETLARAPDGQLVISRVIASKRELATVSLTGGAPQTMAVPGIDAHKGLSATATWSRVAWSDCAEHIDVATATPAGGGAHAFSPIGGGDWADIEPVAVGDKRQLVIVSDRVGAPWPWLVDVDGATPPRNLAEQEVARIGLTPDGATLVYNTAGESVGKLSLGSGATAEKLADGGADSSPAVGLDGVVYFDRRGSDDERRVYSVSLAGGAAAPALPPGSSGAAPSPVGKQLIYAQGKLGAQKLVVRELASGHEHVLSAELPAIGPWHVRWSADGARAVCSMSTSDVFVVDVVRGKVLDHVSGAGRTFLGGALVGPHGEQLVVGENWLRGSVWLAEPDVPR